MRDNHVSIFFDAANHFQCWIIVRPSNSQSDFYLSATNCEAKPLSCKAKSANNQKHKLAGLVVHPDMVPKAFKPESLSKAIAAWKKFEPKLSDDSSGYSVVQEGDFRGCVTLGGRSLHSDYDLLAVIPLDADQNPRPTDPRSTPRRTEHQGGDVEYLSQLVDDVKKFFNSRVPRPLVRHGADFDDLEEYRPGTEVCDWFGPGRRHEKKLYVAEVQPYLH